ncbi:diguanylate cyclase domain-containing protein, partial [Zwartia sp.]|uniref:diguanylate cyclase domain-containing protein n=1 Tax=Zwartia sp. TaxID=2978004 RepID=UPI002727A7AA
MNVKASSQDVSRHKLNGTDHAKGSFGSGYRIRTLLLTLLAFHMFALVAALTFMTFRQYKDEVAEKTNLATAARVFSVHETERFIEESETLLSKLAAYPAIRSLDVNNCDRLLAELQYLSFIYANLITLDRHGNLVCSGRYVQHGAPRGPDPKYFFSEAARTNAFTIGKPAVGFVTGNWVSGLAYPIRDDRGQFNGVVVLAIDLMRFKPFVPSKVVPRGTYSGIINSDGVMIAASEGTEALIGKVFAKEPFEQAVKMQEGSFRMTDYQGSKRLVSFGPVKDSDWSLFVSLDEASVLDPIIKKGWRRLAFIILIMSVLGLLTRWVARRIAQPFESVSETVARVGAGDAHARAQATGPLEARQIAHQLNDMLDARELAVLELKQSEERFRTAFRTTPDALAISRLDDGLFLEVNDGFIPQSGWSREEIIGKTSLKLNIWRWPNERQKLLGAIRERGSCTNLEAEFIAKDGRIWTGIVSGHLIVLDGMPCILSVTRDVTESRKSQELIHNLSYSDLLTGLPNRRLFMDRLEQAIVANLKHQTIGALIFINVDDFKSINDSLGHGEGDLLLLEVAKRLKTCIRSGDTVARLGGDEFIVLVPELDLEGDDAHKETLQRCQHILTALSKPYQLSQAVHHRSACIGVSLIGKDEGQEAHEALQRVEIAMHHAKAA